MTRSQRGLATTKERILHSKATKAAKKFSTEDVKTEALGIYILIFVAFAALL